MSAAAQTVGGMYQDALISTNISNVDLKQSKASDQEPQYYGVGLGDSANEPKDSETSQANQSNSSARARKERLAEIKDLLEDGLITQAEYDEKRKEILAEI